MRRINRPFAAILGLAVLALLSRFVLVHFDQVPAIIRHHLADFGFAAVLTLFLSSFVNVLTPQRGRQLHTAWITSIHMVIALAAMAQGLNIEYQDYVGEDEEGLDPGRLMSEWFGAPNSDTFDWRDIVAIVAGGLLVLYLQWRSTLHVRHWRRFLLLLRT